MIYSSPRPISTSREGYLEITQRDIMIKLIMIGFKIIFDIDAQIYSVCNTYIHIMTQWQCLDEKHSMCKLFWVRLILPTNVDHLLIHGWNETLLWHYHYGVGGRCEYLNILHHKGIEGWDLQSKLHVLCWSHS